MRRFGRTSALLNEGIAPLAPSRKGSSNEGLSPLAPSGKAGLDPTPERGPTPRGLASLALVAVLVALPVANARAATWDPSAWSEIDTLELKTDARDEGPYWFPVWLVVIDGQVYVRLGTRAAERIEESETKPFVGVRIEGQEFERVEGVPAPEMVDAVAHAMGEKYWSDVFVRFFAHPLTLRLMPQAPSAP